MERELWPELDRWVSASETTNRGVIKPPPEPQAITLGFFCSISALPSKLASKIPLLPHLVYYLYNCN